MQSEEVRNGSCNIRMEQRWRWHRRSSHRPIISGLMAFAFCFFLFGFVSFSSFFSGEVERTGGTDGRGVAIL